MPDKLNKVTIGVPVYNGERYLEESLRSLLEQTYRDFELVISDNASTDRTEEICRRYADQDRRIRYVRQPENLGAIPNFNHVFEISNSQYFKWAAADDLCHPRFLEKCVKLLDQHPDVVWCHSRSSHIDGTGSLLDDRESLDVSYVQREAESPSQRFRAVVLGAGGCLDSYGLFRSEFIRKTPLFLPYYGPEKVFIAELALHGKYREIPETLFFARVAVEGSGNIESAADQQTFVVGRKKKPRLQLTRLKFLQGYLKAIRRAQLPWGERLRCYGVLLRWLLQVSKWKSLLVNATRGRGVGAGNVERLKQIQLKQLQTTGCHPGPDHPVHRPGEAREPGNR